MKTVIPLKFLLILGLYFTFTSCETDNSSPPIISTENEAPEQFELFTVSNNSIDIDTLASFTWETATDGDGDNVTYSFFLDVNENPEMIISNNLTSTSYSLTEELEPNTKYYWKVIASDSNGNSTVSPIFNFTTRGIDLLTNNLLENAPFPPRNNHSSVIFNNRIWIIGGSTSNNVWSSLDGINWSLATEDANFSPREFHTSLVFDNKIWVIGGFGLTTSGNLEVLNDVWSSLDGINWTLENDNANFQPRFAHSSLVFDNKMWIINGLDPTSSTGAFNEIWNSSDGITWDLVNDNPALNGNIGHGALVFQNKIWVLGGRNIYGLTNDIYSSSDGIEWEIASYDGVFSPRYISAAAVVNNRMWVFGGESNIGLPNDSWYSSDGISWFEATSSPFSFSPRMGHSASVLNNSIYLIAGYSSNGSTLNDVWILEDQ